MHPRTAAVATMRHQWQLDIALWQDASTDLLHVVHRRSSRTNYKSEDEPGEATQSIQANSTKAGSEKTDERSDVAWSLDWLTQNIHESCRKSRPRPHRAVQCSWRKRWTGIDRRPVVGRNLRAVRRLTALWSSPSRKGMAAARWQATVH
jgi:hypothetical protein